MTIAVGFKCYDGILLATDTMYSGGPNNSDGEKMWVLSANDPAVVFAGSGTVGPLTRARDEIERKIKPGMSLQRTLDTIDDALMKVDKKFPPRDGWPHVQALVAIRADGRNRLYQNVAREISLSPVDAPHVCVGQEALGNYFAESLFREGMVLEWAEIVAAYLVANCKKFAAGYCGGDTHLAVVPRDEQSPAFMKTGQGHINQLESYLFGIERALRAVLPGGSPAISPTAATLKTRAKFIIDAIERAETDSYQLPHEEIDQE
jgi:hypothetical protein